MLNIKQRGLDATRNLVPPGTTPCLHAFGQEQYVCTQAVPCHLLSSHQPLPNRAIFSLAHMACRKNAGFFLPKCKEKTHLPLCKLQPVALQETVSYLHLSFNITFAEAHEVKVNPTVRPPAFGLFCITTTVCHPVIPMWQAVICING